IGISFFSTNIAFDLALKACQYQFLIDKTVSVWCKFFDLETMKLLEYKEDIENNCKYGFKYDISRLMACDLIKDLMGSLKEYRKGLNNRNFELKI
ncbi:multiple inositol polyphosphate phosphatase 1-like, partial [Brachionus plicatilis]